MAKSNKVILIIALILVILLIIFAAYKIIFNAHEPNNQDNQNSLSCTKDSDCVKQQTSCCPCNAGGKEVCMNKDTKLSLICPPSNELICPQVYSCREISCICVEGKCTE